MEEKKEELKVCGSCLSGNIGKKFHESDFDMRFKKGHKLAGIDFCLDCGSDYIYTVKNLLDKAREEGRKEGIKLRKMLLVDDDYIMTHPRYISDWSDKYNKHYKCNRCKSKCLIPVIEPLVVICPKCGELDLDEIS